MAGLVEFVGIHRKRRGNDMNVSEFKAFFKGLTATGTDGSLSPKQVSALMKAVEELKEAPVIGPSINDSRLIPPSNPLYPPIVPYKVTC